MEWIFFGIFSVIAALLYNFIYPKITAMSWAQTPSASSYAGKTLVTALAFFVVLIAAGFIMSAVIGKKATIDGVTV